MMILKKIINILAPFILIIGIGIFVKQKWFTKPPPKLFTTEKPQKKTIYQIISALGILEIKDLMKIGSVVSGTIKELYVKENQEVRQGQLLAEIDTGTGETDFERAYHAYNKDKIEFEYQQHNFDRQKVLYKAGQLSRDEFEKLQLNLASKKIDVCISKAALEKERLSLSNRKLLAVGDGFITSVNIYKGISVTGAEFSDRPLIEIAPDITEMEIKLDIDESDIGLVKAGQKVRLTINTFPDLVIRAKINTVNFSPKKSNNGSALFYKASIDIANKEKKLRPGMTLNAKISIAKAKNVVCIRGLSFQINPKTINLIAKSLHYEVTSITAKKKRTYKKAHPNKRIKFIWVHHNKTFTEKPITLGITDDNFFEIQQGLNPDENIIVDVVEKDEMEKMYKRWFSGPL